MSRNEWAPGLDLTPRERNDRPVLATVTNREFIVPGERVQRQIDQHLDAAEQASLRLDWAAVVEHSEAEAMRRLASERLRSGPSSRQRLQH